MAYTEQQINDALDKEAIRDLPVRYCHYIRTGNRDGWVGLYADDGEYDPRQPDGKGGAKGSEALRKLFDGSGASGNNWPMVHNHVVELLGPDKAKGWVYMELRSAPEKMRVTNIVVYEDDYVKVDGRWRIKKRGLTFVPVPAGSL